MAQVHDGSIRPVSLQQDRPQRRRLSLLPKLLLLLLSPSPRLIPFLLLLRVPGRDEGKRDPGAVCRSHVHPPALVPLLSFLHCRCYRRRRLCGRSCIHCGGLATVIAMRGDTGPWESPLICHPCRGDCPEPARLEFEFKLDRRVDRRGSGEAVRPTAVPAVGTGGQVHRPRRQLRLAEQEGVLTRCGAAGAEVAATVAAGSYVRGPAEERAAFESILPRIRC